MAKSIIIDQPSADRISQWLLEHDNLPYGLATIAIALAEENEIDIQIEEE